MGCGPPGVSSSFGGVDETGTVSKAWGDAVRRRQELGRGLSRGQQAPGWDTGRGGWVGVLEKVTRGEGMKAVRHRG